MISYGAGLPGGFFLPILTLGALIGAIFWYLFGTVDRSGSYLYQEFRDRSNGWLFYSDR